MTVTAETADLYSLDAPLSATYLDAVFFGSVVIDKNDVSYHLRAGYAFPAMLDDVPAPLRKRMQGKSCFNFTTIGPALDDELAELTRRGFEPYQREGLV